MPTKVATGPTAAQRLEALLLHASSRSRHTLPAVVFMTPLSRRGPLGALAAFASHGARSVAAPRPTVAYAVRSVNTCPHEPQGGLTTGESPTTVVSAGS